MAIEVNGVTLPDIPADALASYPYALIVRQIDTNAGTDVYTLWLSDIQSYYFTAEFSGSVECVMIPSVNISGFYYDEANPESWQTASTPDDMAKIFCVGGYLHLSDTILYSNYDILEVVEISEDGESFITGDVWFPNSEVSYAPEYRVSSDDLIALATQARRLSGVGGKLTVDQMVEQLTGCDFTLQEKTVTPSDVAQEVTPDSGFYGLSKVTVEPSSGLVLAPNERIYQVGNAVSLISYNFAYESVSN